MRLDGVHILFSNINKVDDLSGKYQVTVTMDEATAADAEAAGIPVKTKEYDGATQFQAVFKSKFRPEVIAADGQTKVEMNGGELGRGSKINIQYSERDWNAAGKSGTARDLNKIQVVEMRSNASEFDDVTAVGGDVAM